MTPEDGDRGETHPRRALVLLLVVAVAPWLWFVVRDLGGGIDGGRIQTAIDGVSVLLPLWSLGCAATIVVLGVVRHDWRWGAAAASWVLFLVVACVGPWMRASSPAPRAPIRVVAANLMTSNRSTGAAVDVLAEKADVVVTVETNGRSYTTLVRELGPPDAFGGSAASCSIGKGTCSSVNVWSRFPARVAGNQRVLRAVRGIRMRIDAPSGPFVLYAVHAPAPIPFRSGGGKADPTDQRHRLAALLDAATAERLPVVIAGDLNMPDRTSAYRAFADRMRDAVRSSFATPTSLKWYQAALLLRIDHVFVSKGWCADHGYAFSLGGSDHRGVGADVGRCPTPRSATGAG